LRAGTDAGDAGIRAGAGVAVIAGRAVRLGRGAARPGGGVAGACVVALVRGGADDGVAAGADAGDAGIPAGAGVAVVARSGVGGMDASPPGAAVIRARVAVVAGESDAAAHAVTAGVVPGACVAVVARGRVGGVEAAAEGVTAVVGAGVVVVAPQSRAGDAGEVDAGLVPVAGVLIEAVGVGPAAARDRRVDAAAFRVAAVGCARVAVVTPGGVLGVQAPLGGIAAVLGAGVVVVAVEVGAGAAGPRGDVARLAARARVVGLALAVLAASRQKSRIVHGSWSSQSVSALQQAGIGWWVQPPTASQPSTVHPSRSSQSSGPPAWHIPVATSQVSVPVHTSWSSQSPSARQQPRMGVCVHPFTGSQASAVQTTPSSQSGGAPARQLPVLGSQASMPSQTSESGQTTSVPAQAPSRQMSACVQALLSSHGAVLAAWLQPVAGSQRSSVQGLSSSQSRGGPPAQAPAWQVSRVVQALRSSQAVPSGSNPSVGQRSVIPSQLSATSHAPAFGRQTPVFLPSGGQLALVPEQCSASSHSPAAARHGAPAFPAGCWQALRLPSQVSVVHALPSSVQAVPAALFASAGQSGPFPGQLSARSHSPAAPRQTTLEGWKPSAGQRSLTPSQVSAASQSPAAARHTVPAFPAACWQSLLLPSQVSAVHGLPSSVQVVPAARCASAGQSALLPGQLSARSHSPAAARHSVLEGTKASDGHAPFTPSQVSATSQSPAAGRQTVPAVFNWQIELQQELAEPFAAPSSHCSLAESTTPLPHVVAGVGTASLQACRKWLPKVAQPSQKSPVKVQFPTSTTISTRSSIASWPPWSCVGALMTPKSGPSLLLSMLPGASTKSCAMSQLTSEDWRLLTKLLPHSDFGVGHCPSLPAAQLGQKFEPADHSQVTSGPSVTPRQ